MPAQAQAGGRGPWRKRERRAGPSSPICFATTSARRAPPPTLPPFSPRIFLAAPKKTKTNSPATDDVMFRADGSMVGFSMTATAVRGARRLLWACVGGWATGGA
jgi:hypothetical protein